MNTPAETTAQTIQREMALAILQGSWEATFKVFQLVHAIADPDDKVEVLNALLVMQGHQHHQDVVMQIQKLACPTSIPYIREVLTRGFEMFDYTCSESGVIAKWFSHALASIGTPAAIAMIEEFSFSSDPGVAAEMRYRLSRLHTTST